jgi:hypothetical protein
VPVCLCPLLSSLLKLSFCFLCFCVCVYIIACLLCVSFFVSVCLSLSPCAQACLSN